MSRSLPAAAEPGAAPALRLGHDGMWLFLATELLFFGGLFAAWGWGRVSWPAGFAAAGRHTQLAIGTVNTALLLTASALVALAVAADHAAGGRGRRRDAARWLAAAALLGLLFLGLKGLEYGREWHERLVPGEGFALAAHEGAALFFVLYFVATGLHALHVAIGVALLGTMAWGASRGRPWAGPGRIEIAGLYWHFVDLVWIVLYPLLYLGGRAT